MISIGKINSYEASDVITTTLIIYAYSSVTIGIFIQESNHCVINTPAKHTVIHFVQL